MAVITEIIDVQISIQDAATSVSNFGNIMLVADAPFLAGTVRTYTCNPDGLAAMVTDGFNQGDAAYRAVSAAAAQSPSVPSVNVFSRANSEAQSVNITPTNTTVGYEYSLGVRGVNGVVTALKYTVKSGDGIADIIDGLIASGTPNGVTLTDNSTDFDLTPTVAGTRFHLTGIDPYLTVVDESSGGDIAADLALAVAADKDFYGVIVDTNEKSQLVAAAAWATTNKRLLLGVSIDSEIADSGVSDDVVSQIKATSTHYANVWFTYNGDQYQNIALMSKKFPTDPGSSIWALQRLAGVTVDTFSATVSANVKAKGALRYESYLGLSLTQDGKALSGRYFDITRGSDWLKSIIESAIVSYLVNQSDASKVKFTDVGIGQIEGVIRGQLALSAQREFTTDDVTVVVPKAAAVSTADKLARQLTGVSFIAPLAGAIQGVVVRGNLTI